MEGKKKATIERGAKKILQSFAKKLERVRFKERLGRGAVGGFRKEGSGAKCDDGFRQRVFENAPHKEGDCIIAEKREWQ